MWGDSDDEIETVPTLDAQEKAVEPGIKENKEAPTKELESTNEAEEKTEAAAKIQAVQRGNQERKEIAEKQEAAAKIQAVQRGNQARKEIAEKQEAAAKIQAITMIIIKLRLHIFLLLITTHFPKLPPCNVSMYVIFFYFIWNIHTLDQTLCFMIFPDLNRCPFHFAL
eukprot:Stramenopile-MAST_4_protein_5275